eukprot:920242_1
MAAQAKKQIGQLFRKNLLDLVKGLRSHKGSESEYINECLSDIKSEVASIDKETKAAAISKLTYLYMMGYDIAFAHFNVVEVMSQPSFGHRRIAYLAASLSFRVDTDVILLTVHLFKKRFSCLANSSTSSDGSMYESGCAINCLANICTPYLAETLLEDIYTMMNSSKPYLRKKSVLVLYSIFRKFPKALRLTFDRLKDKLRDEDGGVQNAAVNVICELARKNPSNYLSLLPHLFDLLNNSNNNWMLIKLVKLLGSLIPAEARLGRKLQEPLTHIITNTPAKSLLYECINTVTAQSMMQRSMVRLCLDKLRGFVEDQDQNLKYLGLLGLNKIMDKNKRAVAQHKDLILQCLDDSDITIRMRALDLITSMVNEKNLEVIIQRLTDHLYGTDGSYRDHVLEQIVNVCRRSDYEFVRDFAWYVQLLCTMTGLSSMCLSNALLISSQMMDVTIRVPEVREFSVSQMEELMIDNDYEAPRTGECISHILSASAYIVGEYSEFVCDHLTLVSAMLQSRITSLPQSIQCIFIHNAFKVVATAPFSKDLIARTIQLLEPLATSHFIEVQERANTYLFFMKWFATQESDGCSLAYLFESELMPLHPNSQKVIADKIPNGLDLDEWMFDEAPPYDSDSFDLDASLSNIEDQDPNDWYPSANDDEDKKPTGKKRKKKHTKQLEKEQKIERQNRQVGPFYIGNDDDIDDIDIEVKHMDDPLHIEVDPKRKHKKLPKQKKGKKYTVLSKAKKKHTAESTNNISNKRGENDALSQNIDLSKPIDAKEMEQYTIKPYKQDEIVYKEEEKKHTQKNKKHSKKEQKKKGKKHKKKHKKEKKNEDDLLGFLDTNATQNNDQKRTTNEVHLLEEVLNGINGDHKVKKKKKKKKDKKKQKTKKYEGEPPPAHGYGYNTVATTRPPSTKTGASSVTTNDDNKTFITHSSYYTHSSQRSHPYTYHYAQHRRHHTNTTRTTDDTNNTVSNSGETGSQTTENNNTLNVPGPYIPRAPSEISQPVIILEDVGTVTTDQQSSVGTLFGKKENKDTTIASSDLYNNHEKTESKYDSEGSDTDSSNDSDGEDPDSIEIIHIDSFSFFFQRDSPAQLTNDNYNPNLELDESILPQQTLEMVVHNECIINYGPYADDLRAKLMSNFLPFMYQHRELTPLIPDIGQYFNFSALDIIIKFDEPRFPIKEEAEPDTITQPLKDDNALDDRPWFIFNVPFSANIPDEAKQLVMEEGQVIDNHLMQIKFGANSLIKISIPWILTSECDVTTIDLSLTPCNISSSIRKTDLYHSIVDTDKFAIKYKWTTPAKWNDLQKHDIDIQLEKIDRISSIYFLSEHINVLRSLSTDWFSYRPEVTIQYFVPSITSIKLHAKESEIVTSINAFNVIHIHNNPLLNAFLSRASDEFLDNPYNARLKWKGIVDLKLNLPATDWKPSVSNMNVLLEMRLTELFVELPVEHPFTDMMPNKSKNRRNDDNNHLCLKFRKGKFEMNYIYHLVYYREYRDSMNISIDITDPELKIYGHFLRYYWYFIQNYSSTYSEFLKMEEFRNEYKFNNTTALDKRKKLQNIKDQKINSFEAYTQINVVNASLILPSSIIGSTNNTNYQQKMMNNKNSYIAKIKFEELMFDFRGTDEYNNMYIHSSPIRCMIPLTEQEQSSTKSMPININTFVSIDSFVLQRQGWNGLPPEYLTYSQAIDGDIGKIKVQLFDCQFQRLIHSINAFCLQYKNSFDSRCFDFREKEHLISTTNDNPDQIDYPNEELSIMNINFEIKSIDISIHHNYNLNARMRYQHITRCICPYGIQIKSSSESTLEFAQKTVINCNKIELQHLISTTKPKNKEEQQPQDNKPQTDNKSNYSPRGRNRRGNSTRNRAKSHQQRRKAGSRNPSRQRGNTAADRRAKNKKNRRKKSEKMKSKQPKDDLLCVGSLDSHFQIILTRERSDQEMYHSKQRNFENRQLQQTEDDVEMDQDWPFHLLNTIYMQEPLPKQRSPNRNTKTMPVYQQTELEYELYGKHGEIRVKSKKNQSQYNQVIDEETEHENTNYSKREHATPSVQNLPTNPFDDPDDDPFDDATDQHEVDVSVGTGPRSMEMIPTTADEDSAAFFSAEEFTIKSPQPPSIHVEDRNHLVEDDKPRRTSYLTTPSPDASFANLTKPPTISTGNVESDDDHYQTLSMKQFHVSNYMAKYQKAGGPAELGSGWKKPRHSFHVNADYVPLPEVSYKITAPSLLRKYMNNSNMMTPRPGIDFGWGLQIPSPRRLGAQQTATAENKDNDDKSTLHITYRTHVNIADNTSVVITPEFLDSVHVYMRMLQPKTHSLSEVLDEMQAFVCDFYEGTYSPHYDAPMNRLRHRQHGPNSRISQNTPAFNQFMQKKIISATIGTIHIQSLERAQGAPGIFLLDARISHISIEHSTSYGETPWKTVVGAINSTDTLIHFANASFQGFKAAPSVDRSNGMPAEIKEWGHALDPRHLFETESTEYFVGIEMSDSCLRRTQYMIKDDTTSEEEEVKGRDGEDDNTMRPAENVIHVQHVKVSTSSTAFSNIATLLHRFGRYTNKISQEIPWQNALKMDRLKLVAGEMLTAVDSLPNLKSQPWHRHFLEWLFLRITCEKRRKDIKEAIWGWDPLQKQYVIKRNNYTRASGMVFMVIVRNLIANLALKVERKLNDGFLNITQQYIDPQYLHSHPNMNTNNYNHRNARKRYLFAAQKEQFYTRRVDEFGNRKKIADPIIRRCFIELAKECSEMFFPKQNTNHLKYKESLRWNVSKTSFEVIQDQEKSFTLLGNQFKGFLKIKSRPPQEFHEENGIYTVTISTSIKKVVSQAKPASLDALFSLNKALSDHAKQNMYQRQYQQQYYNNNMYRFGSFGYESYLIPPSYNTAPSNDIGSSHKSSAVLHALRYSKPGHNAQKGPGDHMRYHYHPYYNAGNSNVNPQNQQRWITKINAHIKFGEIRASISTPECADLDVQILKLSLISNRSILPFLIHQSGNISNIAPQHHAHGHSHHSSGSSSFSGFKDEYHHILVNVWKMDARLLLAVELDDLSSGGHSMYSSMSTFDDRQIIYEFGVREGNISVSSIPSFVYDTNKEDRFPRAHSTSSQHMAPTKSSNTATGTTKMTPHDGTPMTPSTPTPQPNTAASNTSTTTKASGKPAKTPTTSPTGSYVEQIAIAIDIEKCVSQILFDRILDSKSNRKRLDIKQLVEPWLNFVQKHIKKNAEAAMTNSNYPRHLDYHEPVEVVQPRCIHLIANLDLFLFRSWLSDKCVCIYTLQSITSNVIIKPNRDAYEYILSIDAGKKQHKLDFIIYKAPQSIRRMTKDIHVYSSFASINTQKFPFVLTRIITKKESQTEPLHNPRPVNDQIYEKYSSFDIGSVADEDEFFERSEKVTIVATIALSKMKAEVSEKMFGSVIRLYSRLRNEATTVIKVYEEISHSLSKIKTNLMRKHSPDTHTVYTKTGYFPQITTHVNIAFEGFDSNISLTDVPNVGAVAKSGPVNLRMLYKPEEVPVRSDNISFMLNSADHLSLQIWDELNEEDMDDNDGFLYDDYERNESDSNISNESDSDEEWPPSQIDNEEEEDGDPETQPQHLHKTLSGTRIVINDNQLYTAPAKRAGTKSKKGNKKGSRNKPKVKQSSSKSNINPNDEEVRTILPLYLRSNIQITAFVQRVRNQDVRNQWHVSQDINLKQTQIQLTPSVITVLTMLMLKYKEELASTLTTNVKQEINDLGRIVLSRMPTMQNIASGVTETGHEMDHEMFTIHDDTEYASNVSYNTNTICVSKATSAISDTSSQKKHNNNIMKPNADQLSVPTVSPRMGATYKESTAFSFHSGTTKDTKRASKGRKYKAQMVESEATDVTHVYLTSMVSMKNFLCVAVLGRSNADRPLLKLSTSINNRHDVSMSNQCQFIAVYCQHAQCGIKSNDLYANNLKVSMDVSARNVIAGLDEKTNTEKLWKIEKYQHFEHLFLNRWRFVEFDMRNEFNSKMAAKYVIKSNIVVADILSIIQPNILQLIINIADNIGDADINIGNDFGPGHTELIGAGDKTANNSNEVNMSGPNIGERRSSPHWDLDINFEWRGGKLSLKDNNTVLSLPYIKLFSSIQHAEQQLQSDTFVLIQFDKISLDMHFLQFVGLSVECLNQRDIHLEPQPQQSQPQQQPQQSQRVSNHTLCVSIANLNTTLSCQPIYDKLECAFNVNDPISICWCQSSLELPNRDDAYSDILTISIPKVSMKISQKKYHLMTHVRFDLDVQRSKGYNVRMDGSPVITTLISLEKVVLGTSALGIITTNLFFKCIRQQLSKYFVSNKSARSKNVIDRYPQSPTHRMKESITNSATAYCTLFCIKDKMKLICDLTELPLINTHIKVGLDQVRFEYQDDGPGHDHLIRARLSFRGVIECSERNRSASPYNKHGHKQHPPQQLQHTHSASSMLGTIMNLANMSHQNEPGSSWKRKLALMKKLEPLQGKFQMNDVMSIALLHHFNPNIHSGSNTRHKRGTTHTHPSFQISDGNPFDAENLKCGINRLQITIPQTKILLNTLTLRPIIEVNTTSEMHIEIQDSPLDNADKKKDNEFAISIVFELEEGIVLRLAPHSIPYLLSAYYTITDFMKREQNDITAHLQQDTKDTPHTAADGSSTHSNESHNNLSLSELSSVKYNRYYLHRGLSPLSWKSQLSSSDFFGPTDGVTDTPLFVIGSFELKARSVALILYVDNNQKNNYVRLHLNHFRFIFSRECKEYQIDDDVNVYFGIQDDVKHGLYVDPNALKNDAGSTKDLIAVPLCHIHYNAKTNIDDFSVTDIFEAKWGNQTFILPLDLRPFDNIGKTFNKYHRDYNEIILKHKKQKNVKQQSKENNNKQSKENNNSATEEAAVDDESLKTIHEKEEQNYHHQKSQTSTSSISSHKSQLQQTHNKRTFNHEKYKFEPPFPSVKYIVSAETILEKLGIKTPQNTIPEAFYLSIVEPISASFGMLRRVSEQMDDTFTPVLDDQQ